MRDVFNPPLQVVKLMGTTRGEEDRGPVVWMRSDDAAYRLLMDGELVWVHGPRHHELATVRIDESLSRGTVVLRDVVGASPSEVIKVVKLDTDSPADRRHYA